MYFSPFAAKLNALCPLYLWQCFFKKSLFVIGKALRQALVRVTLFVLEPDVYVNKNEKLINDKSMLTY